MGQIVRCCVMLALLASIGASLGWGQGLTASVYGTVTDNSGASVPNAIVTVTNVGTAVKAVVKTGGNGEFTGQELPPGNYQAAVEVTGFKESIRGPFTLLVDQRQLLDFVLELGNVSEKVTVSAEAPALETDTATVEGAMERDQTSELPLNGRQFLNLNLLLPGAAPAVKGSSLSTQGGSIVIHGLPENQNFYWVDGVDNTTMAVGKFLVNVPPFTIDEFRVMSPTYDVEFGRSAGGQINVITRSGGNTYHGDVYLFLRNSFFDAKNFFDPAGPIPAFRRGQYGGDLGGRIIRDRLFFYGAFEGLTYAQGESASAIVPTHQEVLGNFAGTGITIKDPTTGVPFTGDVIPGSRINATGAAYAAFYPLPNSGTNTLLVSPTGSNTDNVVVAKGDWVVSSKNRLSFRWAFEPNTYHYPIAQFSNTTNIPGFGLNNIGAHDTTTGLSDTYIFTPNLVGVFRLGWNRWDLNYQAQADTQDWCAVLGIQGCRESKVVGPNAQPANENWYPPPVSLNSTFAALGGGNVQWGPSDSFFITPTLTWIKGIHTLKFGWDFHHMFSNYYINVGPNGSFTFNGSFSGNSLSDLLLGIPYQATLSTVQDPFNPALNSNPGDQIYALQTAAFVQDDIRLSSHLTLNLGLRYDYQFPDTEAYNRFSNLNFANTSVANATLIVASPQQPTVYGMQKDELAPRAGIAWSPSSKWVLRGGAGIFYETLTIGGNALSLRGNPPFKSSYTIVGNGTNITINNALVLGVVGNVSAFTAYQPDIKMSHVNEWSFDVQNAVTPTLTVDLGYVGNRGRDLDGSLQVNTPPPGPGTTQANRPNVNYAAISDYGALNSSQYDGFELRVEKRLGSDSHLLLSYTLSRALDNTTPQNPANLATGWGPSAFNHTDHVAFSYVYQLPVGKGRTYLNTLHGVTELVLGGWQVNGIFTLLTGQPYTATNASNNTNNLYNNGWPNVVGNPYQSTATCQTRTPNCWVNPAAFATPALYTFGNETEGYLTGPGLVQLDFSMAKNFAIGEKGKIQFRAEAFNVFNKPNFDLPGAVTSSTFGIITSATGGSGNEDSRQFQFGLRYIF